MVLEQLFEKCRNMTDAKEPEEEFYLKIDGNGIRICCMDFRPSELLFSSIRKLFHEKEEGIVYENFYCIKKSVKELKEFLPEELRKSEGRYVYHKDGDRLAYSLEYGFCSMYSAERNETYIWLCPDMHSPETFISHPFHMEFSWWALRKNMIFLHSAAVGIDGKGVLIAGAGGSGKSTLSMSALLCGLDLLSDDYLLIKHDEGIKALSLYSTVYLKNDILERLEEIKDNVFYTNTGRDKSLVDLWPYEKNTTEQLKIFAVIMPHIVHSERPQMTVSKDLRKLIPLLASTSYQNRELRNREVFLGMMKLLKEIPAYDLYLSDDLKKNAHYLKEWVKENESNDSSSRL